MVRDIDVALLRAFLAVVETGSVTRAAAALNLTQAAISQQLKRLEDLLGTLLFFRQNRRLQVSAAGERLLVHARRMVTLNDEIWSMIRAPQFAGEVRLGVPHDVVTKHLPAVLRRFDRAFPRVSVTLSSDTTANLLAMLARGELDLTLATEPDTPATAELLLADQLVWVGARRGEAHQRRPLPVSLGAETCMFRPFALHALVKAGTEWRAVCQTGDMGSLLATMHADTAVAPMMRSLVPEGLEPLAPSTFLPPLPAFFINLHLPGAATSPPAAELARIIRSQFLAVEGKAA